MGPFRPCRVKVATGITGLYRRVDFGVPRALLEEFEFPSGLRYKDYQGFAQILLVLVFDFLVIFMQLHVRFQLANILI